MTFWSSETLKQRLKAEEIIASDFDESGIKHCAYELALGPEAFITSSDHQKKIVLQKGESLVIPPGQFAMLITEERVSIPLSNIAFISMRFSIKRRGIINVSGFHVDPGFKGRLKFSVYNAGANNVTVSRGDRIFVMWMANLDIATQDGYGAEKGSQNVICSDDQNVMHGEVASPAELKKMFQELSDSFDRWFWLGTIIVGILGAILVRYIFLDWTTRLNDEDLRKVKDEVTNSVTASITEATKPVTVNTDVGKSIEVDLVSRPASTEPTPTATDNTTAQERRPTRVSQDE